MADEAAKKAKAADKAVKKEQRAAKRAMRKERRQNIWKMFKRLAKEDKSLIPLMLLAWLATAAVFFLVGLTWGGQWFTLVLGLIVGLFVAFWVFNRRLRKQMYSQIEGQAGAAAYVVENLRSGLGATWVSQTGVAVNRNMDTVHRVVGNPGVVLIGEGNPNRLRPMMNKEKAAADRILAGVPVFEIYIGDNEEAGQIPLERLERKLVKLPRNFNKNQVYEHATKIDALAHIQGGQRAGLPKGPMGAQAQNMAGMNRRMRRAAERRGK